MIVSAKVPSAVAQARAASTSAGLLETNKVCTVSNNPKNCSFFATKSVSELTSNTTPVFPSTAERVSPSAAIRSLF